MKWQGGSAAGEKEKEGQTESFRGEKEVVGVFCVFFILRALCGPQEMTMGRRPTIQTTVTASLTKSSLGACNQMLPVKFASKFCVFVALKCVKKQKP